VQPHQSGSPRNHRFVLGERMERNLYNLLETLIAAKYTKNRQRLLEDANLSLEVLRFQMRLAKDLQCLKVESYAFAAKAIDEIGRLVGGWLVTSTLTQDRFCAWIRVVPNRGFNIQKCHI
jgi:hypothetical protein